MSDQKTEQMPEHEKRIREASEEGPYYTAMVAKPDLRALLADLDAARAALSEAKAGGLVLPEGKRVIVVDDSFDQLIYWVDRAVSKGNANTDIQEAYEAWTGWDTYPLPAPPAQRGEG